MYSRVLASPKIAPILLVFAGAVSGQELEPRAYAPNPKGVTFVLLAYSKSQGDVLLDTSLPITDVTADLNASSLLVGRSFGLAGRSASFGLRLPYAWGSMEGNVGEEFRRITRSGLGDLRARLAVNLVGGLALDMREFAKRTPRTTLGASLVAAAPTGQYAPSELINTATSIHTPWPGRRSGFQSRADHQPAPGTDYIDAGNGPWAQYAFSKETSGG